MKNIFIFIAGVATGSAITWYMTKTYYQQLADEEIASVIEEFKDDNGKVDSKSESQNSDIKPNPVSDYEKVLKENGYDINVDPEVEHGGAQPGIEIITPDQCGDEISYGFDVLNYYSDGILAVERNDEIIRDIQETVSELALRSFGLYEPDTVTVRNDIQQMYYEINRCSCTYEQVSGINPEEED